MAKTVKGVEVKRTFEKDGVVYTTAVANVNPEGQVIGYTYTAQIDPPGYIAMAFDILQLGMIVGAGLSVLLFLLGVLIV